jgi:dephospho-CoA kinase
LTSVLRVGLTGGIGSGKSTVAALFEQRGAAVVDADELAHELTVAGGAAIDAIRAAFGPAAIRSDGAMDRDWMRRLAFAESDARQRLERILHPRIRALLDARLAAAPAQVAIAVIPLLVESGDARGRFDRVLVVDCPEETQIARVIARSGLARDDVLAIMRRQASRQQRLAAADDVIFNDGAPDELQAHVARLDAAYRALA